jgi:hypothetical protein
MYFIGWNPRTTVSTRDAIGVAVSKDHFAGIGFFNKEDGVSFSRSRKYDTAFGEHKHDHL